MDDYTVKQTDNIHDIVRRVNEYAIATDSVVDVRPSPIEDAGYGLFTRKNVKKGEFITTYGGRLLRMIYGKFPKGTYVYMFPEDLANNEVFAEKRDEWKLTYRDALFGFNLSEMGRWMNHKGDGTHNVIPDLYIQTTGLWNLVFFATTDIPADTELFIDYGPEYTLPQKRKRKATVTQRRIDLIEELNLRGY